MIGYAYYKQKIWRVDRAYESIGKFKTPDIRLRSMINCLIKIREASEVLRMLSELYSNSELDSERENLYWLGNFLIEELHAEWDKLKKPEDVWHLEAWTNEDFFQHLEDNDIEPTDENMHVLREACMGMFDDCSARNEMIDLKIDELLEKGKLKKEDYDYDEA